MPCNDYNANLGRTKIINKGVIKLDAKKKKEKKRNTATQKEKPTRKLKQGFCL